GLWLIFVAVLAFGLLTGFHSIGFVTIGIMLGLALLGELLELWLGYGLARRYGGSPRAGWGALLGGLVGAVVGVPVPVVGSVVVGVGIDVVATGRMARALAEAGGDFEARVFTAAEREDCRHRADKTEALGARFAAKEACFKALGRGLGQGLAFQQIEVTGDESGRPELRF